MAEAANSPTLEEIRIACLEIQAEWTEAERLVRAGLVEHVSEVERLCWSSDFCSGRVSMETTPDFMIYRPRGETAVYRVRR